VTSPSDAQTAAVITRYDYYSGGRLHGLMSQITEPDRGTHVYTYYANRRAFEVTDPEGHSTHMSYDLYRGVTSFVNERGDETLFEYDEDGLLIRQTAPDRSRDRYTFFRSSTAYVSSASQSASRNSNT
jgi:YD repeat-containing protein